MDLPSAITGATAGSSSRKKSISSKAASSAIMTGRDRQCDGEERFKKIKKI